MKKTITAIAAASVLLLSACGADGSTAFVGQAGGGANREQGPASTGIRQEPGLGDVELQFFDFDASAGGGVQGQGC